MTDKFIAQLCFEARQAVVAHRRSYEAEPERHRGCLWCEDGRLSHWATDMYNFYSNEPEVVDKALKLYDRAYPRGYEKFACEVSDNIRINLPDGDSTIGATPRHN